MLAITYKKITKIKVAKREHTKKIILKKTKTRELNKTKLDSFIQKVP
jgi:hypothetical protein